MTGEWNIPPPSVGVKKIALGLRGAPFFFWLVVGPLHWWWPEAGLIWSRHVSSGCCLSSQAHVSLLCFQSCNRNARNMRLGNRPSPPSGFLADLMSSPVPGWRTVSSEALTDLLSISYLIKLLYQAQGIMSVYMCCLPACLCLFPTYQRVFVKCIVAAFSTWGLGYTIIHCSLPECPACLHRAPPEFLHPHGLGFNRLTWLLSY